MIDTVRISETTKRKLTRLKRHTGIDQWNILCRWALCFALASSDSITAVQASQASNVEMTWKVFAGKDSQVYRALVRSAAAKSDIEFASEHQFLNQLLETGATKLLGALESHSVDSLLGLAAKRAV